MSSATIPAKTQLGIDELRHRTRRLSQRHRTMLLLIDGQRPLSEVLSLAHQAGAATGHFEELLMLGLVELPMPPMQPEPEATLPDAVEQSRVSSVDLPVVSDEPGEPEPATRVSDEPARADALEPAPPPPEPSPVEESWERTIRLPGAESRPGPEVQTVPREPDAELPMRRPPLPTHLPVLDEVDEGSMLQQVRDLLIDTLRLDAPLFGARTFVQVRAAQTSAELIDLVWEIEHHLSHARHSRKELLSLQRARELLGLGNTLVADDNPPGLPEY